MSLCHHCGRSVCLRARGLCAGCYRRAEVRTLYPPLVPPQPSAHAAEPYDFLPPTTATPHPPGSEGKLAVMAERVAAGQGLWHRGDGRADLE